MTRSLLVIAALSTVACGSKKLFATYEVPKPGPSMPYGLVAVDVESGDTRRPVLKFARTGYIPRFIPIPRDGVIVARINPGDWDIQAVGSPGAGDVITFDGGKKAAEQAGPRSWPDEPLTITVRASKLTNVGHLCVHRGCKAVWAPNPAPDFKAWEDVRRLVTYAPPKPKPKPKPAEGKAGAGAP